VTYFKAQGSIGKELHEQIYGGIRFEPDIPEDLQKPWKRKHNKYATLQSNAPVLTERKKLSRFVNGKRKYFFKKIEMEFPNSPGIWASNEGFVLGQVNFPGDVDIRDLFEMLNVALRLVDRKGKLRDFRKVYRKWKWKYQVVRILTVPKNREAEFKREVPRSERVQVLVRKSGRSR